MAFPSVGALPEVKEREGIDTESHRYSAVPSTVRYRQLEGFSEHRGLPRHHRTTDCSKRVRRGFMTGRRIVGILLLVAGVVVLALGGVFWTDRDTVVDAGPLQIQTENREGIAVPPLVGGALLVGGVLLLVLPDRRRV